jgi:transcriptional regulator of acetoin/glycerol metabolism
MRADDEYHDVDQVVSATGPTQDVLDGAASSPVEENRRGLVAVSPARGQGAAPVWRVARAVSVGRGRQVDVSLEDDRVSRAHARLEPRSQGILVRDLGSRHGSFVGGHPVSGEGTLAGVGAVVRFGDTLLLVVDDVEAHRGEPRTIDGGRLGLRKPVMAGGTLSKVWDHAARVAQLKDPVFVMGESGSGKELIARIVHAMRPQRGPFVGLNVAAIPEALFEAELFGYERGAFTGAGAGRAGAFREASGGVLFLDEVGDLRPDLQVKLLRAIDTGAVRPLGADRDVPFDVRLVAATSRDPKGTHERDAFRADLYYRLAGIVIRVPPLRERREDILLLARAMLGEHDTGLAFTTGAEEALLLADWEGNVRHLRHAVTHAVGEAVASGAKAVRHEHLPKLIPARHDEPGLTEERIRWAMKKERGVASRAAGALGVSRTTLYEAVKRLNLDPATLRSR